ncbi:MAG: hypothetical protein LBM67_01455 [Lentimicrobiaceae bacterium]|nr:hypothetical protein [Lentimicrobiaceae bacterium]
MKFYTDRTVTLKRVDTKKESELIGEKDKGVLVKTHQHDSYINLTPGTTGVCLSSHSSTLNDGKTTYVVQVAFEDGNNKYLNFYKLSDGKYQILGNKWMEDGTLRCEYGGQTFYIQNKPAINLLSKSASKYDKRKDGTQALLKVKELRRFRKTSEFKKMKGR